MNAKRQHMPCRTSHGGLESMNGCRMTGYPVQRRRPVGELAVSVDVDAMTARSEDSEWVGDGLPDQTPCATDPLSHRSRVLRLRPGPNSSGDQGVMPADREPECQEGVLGREGLNLKFPVVSIRISQEMRRSENRTGPSVACVLSHEPKGVVGSDCRKLPSEPRRSNVIAPGIGPIMLADIRMTRMDADNPEYRLLRVPILYCTPERGDDRVVVPLREQFD